MLIKITNYTDFWDTARYVRIACAVVSVLLFVMTSALAQRADFTQDQKQRLKALVADTRSNLGAQRDALRQARSDLFNVYRQYNLDENQAQNAIERINKAQLQLMNIQLDNQIKLRQILNSDQFAVFQNMMSKRMPNRHRIDIELPRQDWAADYLLDKDAAASLGLSPDQKKRAASIKKTGENQRNAVDTLRKAAQGLTDMYASYNLDQGTARKLISQIHRQQVLLASAAHKKQQMIRTWLTADQFGTMQAEISKRFQQGGFRRGDWMKEHSRQH